MGPATIDKIEHVDVLASNDEWKLSRDGDWALSLHLDHEAFGFNEIGDSSLSITLNGACSSDPCDAVLAVSFGDDLFLPLAIGGVDFNIPSEISLISGDVSHLPPSFFDVEGIDDAIAPKSNEDMEPMSVTLEFVNNHSDNTLSFKFNGVERSEQRGSANQRRFDIVFIAKQRGRD